MNIALIIAGGSGSRMGQDIPKQFINVYDKPVLIYTLEGFQKHPQIDAIELVCIDGWHEVVWAYARQFNIDKLKWVISGGATGQESIRNGVFHLEGKCADDDIVVIHDGIRPLVDEGVLTDVLQHGPTDVYVFRGPDGRTWMAPALPDAFPEKDVAAGIIRVNSERLKEVAVYED